MKKICSGTRRDEGIKWFTELSDKGICAVVQFYPWYNVDFPLFYIHHQNSIDKTHGINIEPRIKLNYNICISKKKKNVCISMYVFLVLANQNDNNITNAKKKSMLQKKIVDINCCCKKVSCYLL